MNSTRIRKAEERGRTSLSWLDSRHTFSFAEFHDPDWMGFRGLRVLNDDIVAPDRGFGAHPHRQAEILTFVIEGALEHRDSAGGRSVLRAGDVQLMQAGSGIVHSEMNASATDSVRFLQTWLIPGREALAREPRWRDLAGAWPSRGEVRRIAAADDETLRLESHASVWLGRLQPGQAWNPSLQPDRALWLQATRGALRIGEQAIAAGDGLAVVGEADDVLARDDSDFVAFVFER